MFFCTFIVSPSFICILSVAAIVGTPVSVSISLASFAGPLNIICIPKCVITAARAQFLSLEKDERFLEEVKNLAKKKLTYESRGINPQS